MEVCEDHGKEELMPPQASWYIDGVCEGDTSGNLGVSEVPSCNHHNPVETNVRKGSGSEPVGMGPAEVQGEGDDGEEALGDGLEMKIFYLKLQFDGVQLAFEVIDLHSFEKLRL